MRKFFAAVIAAGLVVAPAAMPAASAEDDDAASLGRFTTPFREGKAPYDPATNTFGGERGDTGCLPADDKGHKDCLPAGASENVLADGRILYWNAIEGAEDLDSIDEAAVPSGGDLARDDRSRVLALNWDDPHNSVWTEPANSTGYFPDTPTEPPLIPGTDNGNSNEDKQSDGSLFCADQKQLANGTILAAGGTNYYAEPRLNEKTGVIELEGVRNARIFDPADNTWKQTGDLNYGRWYPSMVTLANGDVFIASGVTKLIKPVYPSKDPSRSGDNVPETETYDPDTRVWTDNGESAQRSLPLFPRLHLLPNGDVYYDAAGQSFNPMGQSYKQALWNVAATYDPDTKTWTDLGVPGLTNGTSVTAGGEYAEPGFRGSTFSQALPYIPREDGTYTKGAFLTAGGVTLMSPGSYKATDTTRINQVDVSGGTAELTTVPAERLGRPRWYSSAVTLPTGQVFAFSGADIDEVISPGSESPIRQAEVFTPYLDGAGNYIGGRWDDVAVANRKRTYHNNAVLLPDARILVGGHAPIPNGYRNVENAQGIDGVREASNNFKDASFEIFEPPYLHWGESRPVIGKMDPTVRTGQQLIVPTADPETIDSIVLVRNPSETHLIDADQRVVHLPFNKDTDIHGAAIHLTVPSNTAVLPPGPYMLFINKQTDKGLVPSVAKQVFVDEDVPGWARGAATYPTDEEEAAPGPGGDSGSSSGSGQQVGPGQPRTLQQNIADTVADVAGSPVASERPADGRRNSALLALASAAFVMVGMSLAGTRRRRVPVRIDG